jgi:hypothetical protein
MAEIIVTTLSDDSSDGLTLREAIARAAAAGADRIRFADGLAGTVTLGAAGQLTIEGEGDLVVEGARRITIDANADGDEDASTTADGREPEFSAR